MLRPALLVLLASQSAAGAETLLGVATSLRTAVPELIARFEAAQPGPPLVASYGGSGALAQQVEAGAPLDAVVLAAAAPVDALIAAGLADAGTRRVIATNELVLIVPRGGAQVGFATLDRLPAGERIAIGDPASVPVGIHAREALLALGLWERVSARLVPAADVAAALAYARRGEVGAAIVYATDARGVADVEVREVARGPWAPRPELVAVRIRAAADPERAGAFLAFLGGGEAASILRAHGFGAPGAP
jgi:molybdate transport system substrate-binding protein